MPIIQPARLRFGHLAAGTPRDIRRIAAGHRAYLKYRALMDVKSRFGSEAVLEKILFSCG
jgi:hypothetical protein